MHTLSLLVGYILGQSWLVTVYGFPFSSRSTKASGGSPPIGTIDTTDVGKPEGESGFRQINKDECKKTISLWRKKLRVPSGAYQIETFEMLNFIDQFAELMPGQYPQRRELIAFGDFENGEIKCMSCVYCSKLTCPWELDCLVVAEGPLAKSYSEYLPSLDRSQAMLDEIAIVCTLNAILPSYIPLHRYEILRSLMITTSVSTNAAAKAVQAPLNSGVAPLSSSVFYSDDGRRIKRKVSIAEYIEKLSVEQDDAKQLECKQNFIAALQNMNSFEDLSSEFLLASSTNDGTDVAFVLVFVYFFVSLLACSVCVYKFIS